MFSLFRSSKLFRFGYGVTKRSISLQTIKLSTFVDKSTNLLNIQNGQLTFTRAFASPVFKERLSVEKTLHQLDHEVRSKGRISGKDIEEVIEAIKYTKNVSSSQALLLIRCCGNLAIEEPPAKRSELVAKVMATLKNLEVPLDISHYNALLKVYLENKTDFLPFEFLKELENSNLRPNRVTYQYLIGTFCIRGDITGATKILELMKENKVPINENIFNYLIMGHSEANDIESAADIINIMREKGIEPSAASYAALLCGYAKNGEIEKLRETINQCEKEEISLLDRDYMDVIFALATNGHEQHVDEFIEKMKKYSGYNQDIVNLVYRLASEQKDEVCLKLVKSMVSTPGIDHKNGMFLIAYLMRNKEPIQRLVYFAKGFKTHGINDYAILAALKELMIREKEEDAIFLLKNMRDCNIEVRPHFFYPLFCQAGRRKDNKRIIELLKTMRMLSVSRSSVTIKDFAVPNFHLRDVKLDFGSLFNTGLNSVFTAEALFTENVKMYRIDACEKLAKNFYLRWDKRWTQPLNKVLIEKKNVESYVTIYAHLHDSYMKEYRIIDENLAGDSEAASDVVVTEEKENVEENVILPFGFDRDKDFGEYVIKKLLETNGSAEVLVPVLKGMLNYGIGIRESAASILGEKVKNPEALELLQKLSNPNLEPKPIVKDTEFLEAYPNMRVLRASMTKSELNDKDKHFLYTVNQKLLSDAKAIFEEYKKEGTATKFHYLLMVKVYTLCREFDNAYETGKIMLDLFKNDALVEPFTELYFVETMMNLQKFDEAAEYFKTIDFSTSNPEILFNHMLRRYIAENKDLSRLPDLLDIALEKRITVPRHYSIIAFAYLERKKYKEAVDIFEHVATKYQYPVIKMQLLKEIVLHGNAQLLERVTNALAEVNGQISSLIDLVATFAECNKPKQARRLLETPGLELRDGKLSYMCKQFMDLGNAQAIECLAVATKGMKMLNRNIIYNFMLDSAIELNDPAKALNLWTEMQEEELTPSDAFLRRLSDFLKSKGLPVPFVVSDTDLEVNSRGNLDVMKSFEKALEEKDHERICKVVTIARKYQKFIPFRPLLNYLHNEIITKGKCEQFDEIRAALPTLKPYLTYDAMSLLTYANANNVEGYLRKKIQELSEMEPYAHTNRFPQRALINHALHHPELIKIIEKANKEATAKKINVLSNVLWVYNLVDGKLNEATEIYPNKVPANAVVLLRSFCELKKLAEPLEKLLDLKDQFKLDASEIPNLIVSTLNVYKKEKNAEKMQKFINAAIEKGYGNAIPHSFVAMAKGQTSWEETPPSAFEDPSELKGAMDEEEITIDIADKKPEPRKFKAVESEVAEEPKKVEMKTESI